MKRPFGVTVLAILSGFLAALAIFGALRFLGVMGCSPQPSTPPLGQNAPESRGKNLALSPVA